MNVVQGITKIYCFLFLNPIILLVTLKICKVSVVALEANCSYPLSGEVTIVGRRLLTATPSDLPECSRPMDEPSRELGPGHSRNEALLWLQSFLWGSLSAWPKFSELCFSYPILRPSSVLFQMAHLHHPWRLSILTYSCLVSLYHLCACPPIYLLDI